MSDLAAQRPLLGDASWRLPSIHVDDLAIVVHGRPWSTPQKLQPRFGDMVWELVGLEPAASRYVSRAVRFEPLPSPAWALTAREICYWRLSIQGQRYLRGRVATPVSRHESVRPATVAGLVGAIREVAEASQRLELPPDLRRWVPAHISDLQTVAIKAGAPPGFARVLRLLWQLAPVLTGGGLRFDPLDGQGTYAWVGARMPKRQVATNYIEPQIFGALVGAARSYVELFADDILAARRLRADVERRRAAGEFDLRARHSSYVKLLGDYLAGGGVVPLCTVNRDVGARKQTVRGQVCWRTLNLLTGANPKMVQQSRGRAGMQPLVDAALADGRSQFGGLPVPISHVERADGTVGPWREAFCWVAVDVEIEALRAAAAIVIAAVTGMRESELYSMDVDAVTDWHGHPALVARKIKRANGQPAKWWAHPLAIRAAEILAEITPDPDRLLAIPVQRKRYAATAAYAQAVGDDEAFGLRLLSESLVLFIRHVNESPTIAGSVATIPDLGGGHLASNDAGRYLSAHRFRVTLAAIAASFPLADLALQQQLKHARMLTTWSYMAAGEDHVFARILSRFDAEAAIDFATRTFAGLWAGGPRLAGPAGRALTDEFRERLSAAPPASRDLPDDASDAFVAMVVTEETLLAFLRDVATEVYPGTANHCRFDPAKARCLAGLPVEQRTAPLLSVCQPEECANAVFSVDQHLSLWEAFLDELEALLRARRLPPAQREVLARRRDRVAAVVADLRLAEITDGR